MFPKRTRSPRPRPINRRLRLPLTASPAGGGSAVRVRPIARKVGGVTTISSI